MYLPIRELADDDFVLLHGDQSSQQAQSLLLSLQPLRVIIHWWVSETLHRYYLLDTVNVLARLENSVDEAPVAATLSLNNLIETTVVDANTNEQDSPRPCIISEEQRIIGFYDHSIQLGEERHRGTSLEEESGLSTCLVKVDFPREIALGSTVTLAVSLVSINHKRVPATIPAGHSVDVVITTPHGLRCDSPNVAQLVVPGKLESPSLKFQLSAVNVGLATAGVLCLSGGRVIGSVILRSQVFPSDQFEKSKNMTLESGLKLTGAPPADLTLLIDEQLVSGRRSIGFRLIAFDQSLDLNFKTFDSVVFETAPEEYFQRFFHDIEKADDILFALERKGVELFEKLLPSPLQEKLWSLRHRIQSVLVQSDEPWVPWELMKLCGEGEEDGEKVFIEGEFLCQAFEMTRWMTGFNLRSHLSLNSIALVAPSDSGLPAAREEKSHFEALTQEQRTVTLVPATVNEVIRHMSKGVYDCWHFIGHGVFDYKNPDYSYIELEGGGSLSPEHINGQVKKQLERVSPLVFLNACQMGRSAFGLTGVGGWASRFVKDCKVAAFIGTLWSINDEVASVFAKELYSQLMAGFSIGRAVKGGLSRVVQNG
jgi:hypothetical protein